MEKDFGKVYTLLDKSHQGSEESSLNHGEMVKWPPESDFDEVEFEGFEDDFEDAFDDLEEKYGVKCSELEDGILVEEEELLKKGLGAINTTDHGYRKIYIKDTNISLELSEGYVGVEFVASSEPDRMLDGDLDLCLGRLRFYFQISAAEELPFVVCRTEGSLGERKKLVCSLFAEEDYNVFENNWERIKNLVKMAEMIIFREANREFFEFKQLFGEVEKTGQ